MTDKPTSKQTTNILNLKEFSNIIDENYETLYTILIYNKSSSVNFLLNDIKDQRTNAKNITNSFKKNKIMDRLTMFENHLINNYLNLEIETVNAIFLIDDVIRKFDLTPDMIEICKEYGMRNYFIKVDKFFHIDYLIDYFTNFNFIYNIKINKSNLVVIKMNANKEKEVQTSSKIGSTDVSELCKKIRLNDGYKDIIFITGTTLNILGNDIIIKSDNLSKNDVWTLYENELMRLNLVELEKRMREISNPKYMDLYVFGKLKVEIKEAMECYQLKELFIEEKKLEKLKEFVDLELFNFKIYPIRSLDSGDIASDFIKSYNGIMGIKYF